MADLEMAGHWWRPGDAEEVPGRLAFSAKGGGTLELIGTFEESIRVGSGDNDYPALLGRVSGQNVTLVDCFQLNVDNLFAAEPHETVHVNQVFRGRHYPDGQVLATGILAEIRHLAYWISTTGLSVDHSNEIDPTSEVGQRFLSVHADIIPVIRVDLGGGESIELQQALRQHGDGQSSTTVHQTFTAWLCVGKPTPSDDLLDRLSDLRDLISIAADAAATFDEVKLSDPDETDPRAPYNVTLHAQWSDWSSPGPPIRAHSMIFTWHQVGPEGLRRWMHSARQHRSALGRVMASRHRSGMVVDDRLLHRCASLESFDRIRTGYKESKFKTRLTRCIELAGSSFEALVEDPDLWAEMIRRDRDQVAHNFGREKEGAASRLLFLGESAYWLFVLCILRDAELAVPAERVPQHTQWRWLQPRLAQVIARGLDDDGASS